MKQLQLFSTNEILLGDLCEIVIGRTPKRVNLDNFGGDRIWVSIGDMNAKYIEDSKEKLTDKGAKECKARLIPEGTLLLSFKLSLGKVAITKKPLYTNEAIAALIPKRRINIKYFYYYLKQIDFSVYGRKAVKGLCLNTEILSNIKIKLVPIEVQDKIVSVLEKAEQLKEWRSESDKLTDDYRNSIFLNTFGNPLLAKRFELKRISELTSLVSYGFTRPMPHIENGIPVITSKNVSAGNIDFCHVDYTDEKSYNELSKKDRPITGDLLYTKDGRIGEAALVKTTNKFCISQAVAILRPLKEEINPQFFESLLNTKEFRRIVHRMSYGVALKHVSISKLKQISIISPPMELQNRFVSTVLGIEKIRSYQQESSQNTDNLFKVLAQKAFNGEFVC
jgi:type I restriction enzyme S subunit